MAKAEVRSGVTAWLRMVVWCAWVVNEQGAWRASLMQQRLWIVQVRSVKAVECRRRGRWGWWREEKVNYYGVLTLVMCGHVRLP